jgi:hypothetical protein
MADPVREFEMAIEQPPHPMHSLTTYELKNYRRELEHALKTIPEHAQVSELLQQRLAEVLAEQDSRNQLRQASAPSAYPRRAD